MKRRQRANAESSPVAGYDWICDEAGIHNNLSPFRLRWDKSGCGSFWRKKECFSLGVSLGYAFLLRWEATGDRPFRNSF
jgi:hypothetical protein